MRGANFSWNQRGKDMPQEKKVEEFPIWLKIVIYGTLSLTVLYAAWGMLQSALQS
jgi:hypothetical protein